MPPILALQSHVLCVKRTGRKPTCALRSITCFDVCTSPRMPGCTFDQPKDAMLVAFKEREDGGRREQEAGQLALMLLVGVIPADCS